MLRMDNGPEMVSQALQRFCDGKVGLTYIPGLPVGQRWLPIWPNLKPNTVIRWPRLIMSLWRSATTTTQAVPPMVRTPLAVLAVVLDRLGHREAAATTGGFALSPLATLSFPEINSSYPRFPRR